mmetsp:Transcript_20934/g.63008  ORF Transcript_20934/g.63008 Transcript_20934/m.63008 type:complete len:336 (+) Transcript_20934:1219-2226(+)
MSGQPAGAVRREAGGGDGGREVHRGAQREWLCCRPQHFQSVPFCARHQVQHDGSAVGQAQQHEAPRHLGGAHGEVLVIRVLPARQQRPQRDHLLRRLVRHHPHLPRAHLHDKTAARLAACGRQVPRRHSRGRGCEVLPGRGFDEFIVQNAGGGGTTDEQEGMVCVQWCTGSTYSSQSRAASDGHRRCRQQRNDATAQHSKAAPPPAAHRSHRQGRPPVHLTCSLVGGGIIRVRRQAGRGRNRLQRAHRAQASQRIQHLQAVPRRCVGGVPRCLRRAKECLQLVHLAVGPGILSAPPLGRRLQCPVTLLPPGSLSLLAVDGLLLQTHQQQWCLFLQ